MSESEEYAKAVVEVAKCGTKALDSSDKLGGFLAKTFGVPIENAIGIMSDKLEYVRWERTTRMIDKVNEYQEKKGFEKVRPIPPKFAIPMIESASWEENDELQDIWCRLIVNSLDANFNSEIRYAFIDIIKNLTPLDAKILKYTYEIATSNDNYNRENHFRFEIIKRREISIYYLRTQIDVTPNELEACLDNLYRVRCLQNTVLRDSIKQVWKEQKPSNVSDKVHLTQLGIMFVEACLDL